MKILRYLLARLREPSTLAGVSALGLVFGLPPGSVDLAVQVLVTVAAVSAVALPEASGP